MPEYSLICRKCGLQFDRKIKLADLDDPVFCTNCQFPMSVEISASNIVFKGSWPGKDIKR